MRIAFNDTTLAQGDVVEGFGSAYSSDGLRRRVGLHSVQGMKRSRIAVRTCQSFWGRVTPSDSLGRLTGLHTPIRNLLNLKWPIESGEVCTFAYKTIHNSSV